jgi:hypothetical protein
MQTGVAHEMEQRIGFGWAFHEDNIGLYLL